MRTVRDSGTEAVAGWDTGQPDVVAGRLGTDRPRWMRDRSRSRDLAAIAVLVILPVLVFGLPAILGHAVVPGDDLTQNYPLRVLAGRQLAAGHLPALDPYIWSGSPLLGDWNAGAAYPLTALFAVLPGVAAWTLGLIVTWAVAAVGMFAFLRALRLGSLASLLGALAFAFAGAMPAQIAHFGLVAGMSWVPLGLLAVLRLAEPRTLASRLPWVSVLGAAFGLTTLAGEPRAIDNAVILLGLYAGWQVVRAGRRSGPLAVSVLAGLALGACLGAVQLLPGLAAISTSQRAASSMALYGSGSLAPGWLLLMLVPDLLGGSGSVGQPAFFASYNLAEVTSYVGILPLVAACALAARLRPRRPLPDWLAWLLIAIVGIVLALGAFTPAAHLLVHLPLFGSQRLQSRNIMVTDTALAVLLAYWADDPFWRARAADRSRPGEAGQQAPGKRRRWHIPQIDPATAAGILPAAAVIVVVALGIWRAPALLGWLGVSGHAIPAAGRLAPSLLPFAVLAAAAIGLLLAGPALAPRWQSRLLAGFVAADVIVFTVLAVVAVAPGAGQRTVAGARTTQASLSGSRVRAAPARPPGDLVGGRLAIYDPGLLDAGQLPLIAAPDLNVLDAIPSVQGYSSIVNGAYATKTGSHSAEGDGQDVLSPQAIGDGVLGQLNTTALLTLPQYLVTTATEPAGRTPSQPGRRQIAAGQRATWYLGSARQVSAVTLPDPGAPPDAAAGFQIGLQTVGGATRWLPARAATPHSLTARPGRPVTAVAVLARSTRRAAELGPPTVTLGSGSAEVADGVLQAALTAPQWTFARFDGAFAVFADHQASGALRVTGLHGGAAPGASVASLGGPPSAPSAARVRSPDGVRLTRSVAAIPGWTATWQPAGGQAESLQIRRSGIVQTVDVPAGRGVVSWHYRAPGLTAGLALSLLAAAIIIALALSRLRTLRSLMSRVST